MLELILAIPSIILCSILWRLGGDGAKFWRSFVYPIIPALFVFLVHGFNWMAMLYAPLLMLSMILFSYGVKAPLHKVVAFFVKSGESGDNPLTEILTRLACGLLWSICGIVFVFSGGMLLNFFIYVILSTILNPVFGFIVKDVKFSEPLVGALIALSMLI